MSIRQLPSIEEEKSPVKSLKAKSVKYKGFEISLDTLKTLNQSLSHSRKQQLIHSLTDSLEQDHYTVNSSGTMNKSIDNRKVASKADLPFIDTYRSMQSSSTITKGSKKDLAKLLHIKEKEQIAQTEYPSLKGTSLFNNIFSFNSARNKGKRHVNFNTSSNIMLDSQATTTMREHDLEEICTDFSKLKSNFYKLIDHFLTGASKQTESTSTANSLFNNQDLLKSPFNLIRDFSLNDTVSNASSQSLFLMVDKRVKYQIFNYIIDKLLCLEDEEKNSKKYSIEEAINDFLNVPFIESFKGKYYTTGEVYNMITNSFCDDLLSVVDEKSKRTIRDFLKGQNKLNQLTKEDDKRYLLFFLLFTSLISEISFECKDLAFLLYKLFKVFVGLQEQKYLMHYKQLVDQESNAKQLFSELIKHKFKNVEGLETILSTLIDDSVTKSNLHSHKAMIQDLIQKINTLKEDIYLKQSSIDSLNKEIRLWVYDFDRLKLDNEVKCMINKTQMKDILENISTTYKESNLSYSATSLLINSERFKQASASKAYLNKVSDSWKDKYEEVLSMLQKYKIEKETMSEKYKENEEYFVTTIKSLKYSISKYESEKSNKLSSHTQTEIDYYKFNNLLRNNDYVMNLKRRKSSKIEEYYEMILYDCKKVNPMTKRSLLNLICDIYFKKSIDFTSEITKGSDNFEIMSKEFDEFFYYYLKTEFIYEEIIQSNALKALKGTMVFSDEDERILLFRRFLNIGVDNPLRKEALDVYLKILKSLPVKLHDVFSDEYSKLHFDGLLAYDILNHLNFFNIKDKLILKLSEFLVVKQSRINRIEGLGKLDLFLCQKFIFQGLQNHKQYFVENSPEKILGEYRMFVKSIFSKEENRKDNEFINRIVKNSNSVLLSGEKATTTTIDFVLLNDIKPVQFEMNVSAFISTIIGELGALFKKIRARISQLFNKYCLKNDNLMTEDELKDVLSEITGKSLSKWSVSTIIRNNYNVLSENKYFSENDLFDICFRTNELLGCLTLLE